MPWYQHRLNKDYLDEVYTTGFGQDITTPFFENRQHKPMKMQSGLSPQPTPKSENDYNPTLPATGISTNKTNTSPQQTLNFHPYDPFEQDPFGFSFDPSTLNLQNEAYFSPQTTTSSRTPSLCNDTPQHLFSPSLFSPTHTQHTQHSTFPPSPSSRTTKQESPSSPATTHRKRGRPRLSLSQSTSSSTHNPCSPRTGTTTKGQTSQRHPRPPRLPHNQVERKYRDGLNASLEALRKAVPSLNSSSSGQKEEEGEEETNTLAQQKPSKALILSGAIEYIKELEKERGALRSEVEMLREEREAKERNWGGRGIKMDICTEMSSRTEIGGDVQLDMWAAGGGQGSMNPCGIVRGSGDVNRDEGLNEFLRNLQ